MKVVGFTGTSALGSVTRAQRNALYNVLLGFDCLHHGDCIEADAIAHCTARKLGMRIEIHPPENTNKRAFCNENYSPHKAGIVVHPEKAYLARNCDIVDQSDELIALPRSYKEERRSGTWATIRYARKLGKKVTIIWPDGKVENS